MDQIKKQVAYAVADNVPVKWCNIAEKNIDLLLVNDAFFNSNNIQRLIEQDVKAYLRLEKQQERAGQISEDCLFYPFSESDDLVTWIQEQFFDYEYLPQFNLSMSKQKPDDAARVQHVLDEIFIPRNGFIQLMNEHGCFALVDTRTERIWLNDENTLIRFNASLSQMYAKNQFVQEFTKDRHAQDLLVWLWPVLRHSNIELEKIDHHQYFKLNIWPQFEKGFERKNLLKIAACFAQGAKVADVKQYLELTDETVERFISILLFMHLGEKIEAKQAMFNSSATQDDSFQLNKLKSLFGKLRKKLGL